MSIVGSFKAMEDIEPDGEPEVGIVRKHGEDFERYMHCVLVNKWPGMVDCNLQHHRHL